MSIADAISAIAELNKRRHKTSEDRAEIELRLLRNLNKLIDEPPCNADGVRELYRAAVGARSCLWIYRLFTRNCALSTGDLAFAAAYAIEVPRGGGGRSCATCVDAWAHLQPVPLLAPPRRHEDMGPPYVDQAGLYRAVHALARFWHCLLPGGAAMRLQTTPSAVSSHVRLLRHAVAHYAIAPEAVAPAALNGLELHVDGTNVSEEFVADCTCMIAWVSAFLVDIPQRMVTAGVRRWIELPRGGALSDGVRAYLCDVVQRMVQGNTLAILHRFLRTHLLAAGDVERFVRLGRQSGLTHERECDVEYVQSSMETRGFSTWWGSIEDLAPGSLLDEECVGAHVVATAAFWLFGNVVRRVSDCGFWENAVHRDIVGIPEVCGGTLVIWGSSVFFIGDTTVARCASAYDALAAWISYVRENGWRYRPNFDADIHNLKRFDVEIMQHILSPPRE